MYLKVIAHNMACPNWHVCQTQMNETYIYILSSVPCAWFYLHLDDLVVRCCLKKPPYMEDTVSP